MYIPKLHKYKDDVDTTKSEKVEVDLENYVYSDDLDLFDDPKETEKFIIRTKYMIRKSFEYKQLMKFLKKCRGMYCCGVHNNITIWDGFSINIHHTPLVMEDIVHIIIAKRLKSEESMKQTAIAKEIMMLHYLGLIGLYPLCETCHGYVHSDDNDLFIPLQAIFGDPEAFFKIYNDFISDTLKTKYENIRQLNKGYNIIKTQIPDELVRKYIYVISKGTEMMSTTALYEFIRKVNES